VARRLPRLIIDAALFRPFARGALWHGTGTCAIVRAGTHNSNIDGCANSRYRMGERPMTWTTPTLVEICIGLEINGYLPAEF
jgi:coenzyme PQQ precursor peptide PqqA